MEQGLNDIDKQIVEILLKNAKQSNNEIAKHFGLSNVAIHQRIKKLEEQGIIKGVRARVDYKKMGYDVIGFIGIFFDKAGSYKAVIEQLDAIPEVLECHYTTGSFSAILKIICRDNKHLMDVLVNTIQNISGIARTETFLSLEQAIDKPLSISKLKSESR